MVCSNYEQEASNRIRHAFSCLSKEEQLYMFFELLLKVFPKRKRTDKLRTIWNVLHTAKTPGTDYRLFTERLFQISKRSKS